MLGFATYGFFLNLTIELSYDAVKYGGADII